MTTLYSQDEGGIHFSSERRPGDVRIPNYVYDLWLPLIGGDALAAYGVYCRLEREGTVKGMTLKDIADALRIGTNRLDKINDVLIDCEFIVMDKPEGHKRLMHWTTEIVVLDPPARVSQALMDKYGRPSGYRVLCPWLVGSPDPTGPGSPENPNGFSGEPKQVLDDDPDGSSNVASLDLLHPSEVADPEGPAAQGADAPSEAPPGLPADLARTRIGLKKPRASARSVVPPPPSPTDPPGYPKQRQVGRSPGELSERSPEIDLFAAVTGYAPDFQRFRDEWPKEAVVDAIRGRTKADLDRVYRFWSVAGSDGGPANPRNPGWLEWLTDGVPSRIQDRYAEATGIHRTRLQYEGYAPEEDDAPPPLPTRTKTDQAWDVIRERLSGITTRATFATLYSQARLLSLAGSAAVLEVGSADAKGWIEARHMPHLLEAFALAGHRVETVILHVAGQEQAAQAERPMTAVERMAAIDARRSAETQEAAYAHAP